MTVSRSVRAPLRTRLPAEAADVGTITPTSTDIRWLAGDLIHAIVNGGCRVADVIDLSERLDYVEQTGNGSIEAWYGAASPLGPCVSSAAEFRGGAKTSRIQRSRA